MPSAWTPGRVPPHCRDARWPTAPRSSSVNSVPLRRYVVRCYQPTGIAGPWRVGVARRRCTDGRPLHRRYRPGSRVPRFRGSRVHWSSAFLAYQGSNTVVVLDCTDRITFVELEEGDRKRARPFDSEPQTLTCQQICGRRSDQVAHRGIDGVALFRTIKCDDSDRSVAIYSNLVREIVLHRSTISLP